MSPQDRIVRLTRELNRHNHLYYVVAQPVITDRDFDKMLEELAVLEAAYPEFRQPDSPTQRVGGGITKEFPVFKHRVPMKSLGNSYAVEEVQEFDARVRKLLENEEPVEYLCQLKIDGVALSLHYENGVLTNAVTRGDGTQGDDITANVRTIRSIPLSISSPNVPPYFEVRGEVMMRRPVFDALNAARIAAGEEPLANPRNTTAGTLKQQDSRIVATRRLDFFAYYLDIPGAGMPATDAEAMARLGEWGFPVTDPLKLCMGVQEVLEFITEWDRRRTELDFDIDGIVMKVNQFTQREILGFTSKSPRWAIAYKYEAEQAETELREVTYQVGRTGYVTPVANLQPVLLAGSTVKRASLYNFDEIERLDLHLGDVVQVEKSGEIIPKVLSVNTERRPATAKKVVPPTHCPECGSLLVKFTEGEVGYYCPNDAACPPQVCGRIEHFAHRKAMDIDGLGTEIVQQLVREGLIRNVGDLYNLRKEQLMGLERFAEKSAVNLVAAIAATRNVPFSRVLFALGIRHVGETVAVKLAEHFRTLDALAAATQEELETVPDIGTRIAESVRQWFAKPENLVIVEQLKANELQLAYAERERASDALAGLKFVVSGVFESISRDDLQEFIRANGGTLQGSVSKATDYLVAGANMGPAKLDKATKLGVKIISFEELQQMA